MEYSYLGRISQPGSLVALYLFKPSVSGSGKPLVSLRSCIYVDGKRLRGGKLGNCHFEAIQIQKTRQHFDFACIMKNVNSNLLDSKKIIKKSRLLHKSVYHGVLIDYDHGNSLYKLAVGPRILNVPEEFLRNFDVCPEILCDSIVCFSFKVLGDAKEQPESLVIGESYARISPTNSSVMASLKSATSEAICQPSDSPLYMKSQQITPDCASPLKPTTNLSNKSLIPGNSPLKGHLAVSQLTDQDFFNLMPMLSEGQIIADRYRVTVTI